jgi:hypothetical protein
VKKTEPAFNWLQAAADDGFPCYLMFENDAYVDHLRQDPRFIALIAKLKEQREHYRRGCDLAASTFPVWRDVKLLQSGPSGKL